jgi:hypothetical protein
MEVLKKRMVVGLTKRTDWEERLKSVLEKLVSTIGLKLDERETSNLAVLPGTLANLIYAGVLDSLVLEFGGDACEVELVYYPSEGDADDLDLSVLRLVDWAVEALKVRACVSDPAYATALAGATLEDFSSDRLTVEVAPVGGEGAGKTDQEDERQDADDAHENGEEREGKEGR